LLLLLTGLRPLAANGQKAIASDARNSLLILLQADPSIFTSASRLAYEEKKPKQP